MGTAYDLIIHLLSEIDRDTRMANRSMRITVNHLTYMFEENEMDLGALESAITSIDANIDSLSALRTDLQAAFDEANAERIENLPANQEAKSLQADAEATA